ncbi:MAG TPA: Spo0B domain-containing protein [Virgibacillus sp.]|nr:Spo0B domain-containing protein [Virgibacillus sp.]
MNGQTVVQLLQSYQHDLMNELQIIHGYSSMDKVDRVNDKINALISTLEIERNLLSIHAPEFILWVVQFNHLHENIRLVYRINSTYINLTDYDERIVSQLNQMVEVLKLFGDNTKMYELDMEIDIKSAENVSFTCSIQGEFADRSALIEELQSINKNMPLHSKQTSNGVICEFSYAW